LVVMLNPIAKNASLMWLWHAIAWGAPYANMEAKRKLFARGRHMLMRLKQETTQGPSRLLQVVARFVASRVRKPAAREGTSPASEMELLPAWQAHARATEAYVPRLYDGTVMLVTAEDDATADGTNGWKRFLPRLETVAFPNSQDE